MVIWDFEEREKFYNAWAGWYGWWSYYLAEKEEEVEVFEAKYIKFKDLEIDFDFVSKNYISWQEIYLSLDTNLKYIEKFSKFTTLKKLENYIVLDLNRDTLIKAKNTYKLSLKDIKDLFKEIKLDLVPNIEILLNSIDNQKVDLSLLPMWIPVFVENMWLFKEFTKLKMFNKYILFSDEEKKLIVFDYNFTNLENLLNKRKILFNKK